MGKYYRNMKVDRKLTIIFCVISVFMVAIGCVGLYSTYSLNKNGDLFSSTSSIVTAVLMVAGALYSTCIGFLLKNSFVSPLMEIKKFAERLEQYDFSTSIELDRDDEYGQAGYALNKAKDNIGEIVKELINVINDINNINNGNSDLSVTVEELTSKAESINEAVSNIAASMQESSAASEEMSASIQEVDSSINELSSKAMEGSNNAKHSKARANEVKNTSEKAVIETRKIYTEKQSNMLKVIEEGKVVAA